MISSIPHHYRLFFLQYCLSLFHDLHLRNRSPKCSDGALQMLFHIATRYMMATTVDVLPTTPSRLEQLANVFNVQLYLWQVIFPNNHSYGDIEGIACTCELL